jgi:hypothetical protein
MAASTKLTVFWDAAPCSLIEIDRRFRGTCSLHHQRDDEGLEMEAISTSETSVNFSETARRNILEDSHLQIYNVFTTLIHT